MPDHSPNTGPTPQEARGLPGDTDRPGFLRTAFLFEGGLLGVAYLLGWLTDIDPLANLRADGAAVSHGMLGTLPLLLLFFWSYRQPHPELLKIKRFLLETLAPQLSLCRWYDMLLLSAVAALGEEALFRGVLQPWGENHWGWVGGMLVSNLLFGLVHFITPLYGLLALLIGVYLGLMLDIGGQRNLLTPVVVHGFYDFIAFWVIIQTYRAESAQ
ncbi:MAG: CPBP family intramembrane metalloprotease [Methylococcaceae bacterium]|nr:MAG: CPBP family intramembrane metalloprotease [Methylococcaceae bacterium]